MSNIIPLFSSPLYHSKIENLDYNEIYNQLPVTKFEKAYNELSISSDDYIIDRMPKLKLSIVEHVNNYLFNKLGYNPFDYYFPDSWFVRIEPKGKSGIHTHPNSLFSGVVYVEISEEGGEIIFTHPSVAAKNSIMFVFEQKERTLYNSETWGIKPKRGDIILFPSYLLHEVLENKSDDVRYSFAFNILPLNYKYSGLGSRIL